MIPYNPQGLTPEEVAASRAAHGENIITPQRDDSAWRLLAEKFRDPIIIVLLVAAALSLAIGLHGRQLHRNHRHPLRHPAGHLRGISLRVGRHAAVPPAQPCKQPAARQRYAEEA